MSEETRVVGQQAKRAAVIVGRFNPPTIGHYAVMTAVKKYIKSHPELKLEALPFVVVVEGEKTSKDKKRNPLSGDDRISFMKASGRADGVRFLKAGSAMDAFQAVRRAGFEPIAVAAGSDRAKNYLDMLDKYFKTDSGKPIQHHKIELPREGSGEATNEELDKDAGLADILKYTDKDLPISMVSASLARMAVTKGERQKFAIIVGLTDKPELANKMFDKIKAAMETQDA
jgi:uncharacterized protein YneF (UPF0154 family)